MWLVAGNDWAGCSPSPEISLSFLLSLPLCVLVRVWECGHWWNYSIKVQDERWNIQTRAAAAAEEYHMKVKTSCVLYLLFISLSIVPLSKRDLVGRRRLHLYKILS